MHRRRAAAQPGCAWSKETHPRVDKDGIKGELDARVRRQLGVCLFDPYVLVQLLLAAQDGTILAAG